MALVDATYLRLVVGRWLWVQVRPCIWYSETGLIKTVPCPSCGKRSLVRLSFVDINRLQNVTGLIQDVVPHLDAATRELLMTGMHDECWKAMADSDPDCGSCGEDVPGGECSKSQRPCGHHCNHSWTHDECCWCGTRWEGEIVIVKEG